LFERKDAARGGPHTGIRRFPVAEPTVDSTMAELLEAFPCARAVLSGRGMACVGCPMARFETLAEAARAYQFDAADLLRQMARGPAPRRGRRPS
jgi:hybrid cluster-associated redox disulfide protein